MKMSKKPSQKERILKYLVDFGSITQGEAFMDLGIGRLSARICELRKKGYQIITIMDHGFNRYNERVTFARYTLEAA